MPVLCSFSRRPRAWRGRCQCIYQSLQYQNYGGYAAVNEVSVLIGGKAGDGINNAGAMVAQLLNNLGYRVYLYFDYPSLIRGGHNFAIIRGSDQYVGTHRNHVDFVLALNKETIDRHREKYSPDTVIIFNADQVKIPGNGVPVKEILAAEQAPEIMGNSAIIGAFAKAAGIGWETVETVFRAHMPKGSTRTWRWPGGLMTGSTRSARSPRSNNPPSSLLTGNEAIGLGMVKGGLDAYISYPMTPSSSLLHFLADQKDEPGHYGHSPGERDRGDDHGPRVCLCR